MPLTSSYPPIGGRGASLHQLIAGAAAGRAERPALVNGSTGEVVSYGLLAARIGQVAAGLASRGFGPGDVLALWAPNLPQWAGIALGAMAAGGTVAPVDTSCTEPELTGRLTGSGASILVTIPSMAPTALAAAGAAGVAEVVTIGQADGGTVPGSVGRLAPSGELRVVDPATGADLGEGQPGELWFRGPNVMAGDRDAAGATAEILDADGWLRTGDLGTVDADGNVFILGRLKELIKVNARQVAPAELEAVLAAHPAVADAAVIGRADPEHGEVPVAVVVPRGEVDGDQLMGWVAERVAPTSGSGRSGSSRRSPARPPGRSCGVLIEGDRRAEAV
jgi:acyl-CoA synthetase (AMP-forming)/AMP-acid ligase II